MFICFTYIITRDASSRLMQVSYIQVQNQQLVQQSELQKYAIHDLEDKSKELKERQNYILISINQHWDQVIVYYRALVFVDFALCSFFISSFKCQWPLVVHVLVIMSSRKLCPILQWCAHWFNLFAFLVGWCMALLGIQAGRGEDSLETLITMIILEVL